MHKGALIAALAVVACTVPVQVVQAPGMESTVVEYAIDHTVFLASSGCSAVAVGGDRLVTAKHCLPDEAAAGDSFAGGNLVYISPSYDFAVAAVPDLYRRIDLRPGRRGEHIYVVGFPVQLGSREQVLTVTDGLVAGPVDSEGQARITAPVYFGNSGGGVWADDGSLVGIAVAIYAADVGLRNPIPYVAQSYMVPAELVRPWL